MAFIQLKASIRLGNITFYEIHKAIVVTPTTLIWIKELFTYISIHRIPTTLNFVDGKTFSLFSRTMRNGKDMDWFKTFELWPM